MKSQLNEIIAVLGPTNTGKTHMAIEKMLEFNSGIFGFPLRLLAREVYDKCTKKIDAKKVALITGEEKIIPIQHSILFAQLRLCQKIKWLILLLLMKFKCVVIEKEDISLLIGF